MKRVTLITLSGNEVIEEENDFLTFKAWKEADKYCNAKNEAESADYFESKYIWKYILENT